MSGLTPALFKRLKDNFSGEGGWFIVEIDVVDLYPAYFNHRYEEAGWKFSLAVHVFH